LSPLLQAAKVSAAIDNNPTPAFRAAIVLPLRASGLISPGEIGC
jgi:hypothetical protein